MNTTYRAKDTEKATDNLMDTVTDAAESAVEQGKKIAQDASDGVTRAADYLREGGAAEIGGRVREYFKANPTHALIGAAFVGFVVGRMLSRD